MFEVGCNHFKADVEENSTTAREREKCEVAFLT
jgi:hypothetical protein